MGTGIREGYHSYRRAMDETLGEQRRRSAGSLSGLKEGVACGLPGVPAGVGG